MGKKLLIVESPAKAKTINKILGKDFVVESSVGHVRDLPERQLGVDIENNFAPKYVLSKGKQRVIETLKRAAKSCDAIYLAPDPDREGEAIAWHIREILERDNTDKPFFRVQYNEITARAVRDAIANPGEINMARVDAQQARRVLDRIVGYKVSPMLWRRVQRGLSAGRVQSVALRLVCEREAEIEKFVPAPYWIMGAEVRKQEPPLEPFAVKLARIDDEKAEITTPEQAESILRDLDGRGMQVADIATRTVTRNPMPPFITSTLQQAASSVCGFAPKRTMRIAQTLYEGVDLGEGPVGLITYMRTDSFAISREATEAGRAWVTAQFGADYVPETPNVYRSRSGAQEAHEAIRPTDVNLTPDAIKDRLDPADLKVYRLIWERFVASQMSPAKIAQRTVKVEAVPRAGQATRYTFTATASDVEFPGFLKIAHLAKLRKAEAGEEQDEDQPLPPLRVGEPLEWLKWNSERKETKPPPRFSEAALIRELERNGVGRPSTYAQILATLQDRRYLSNEKRTLAPTSLGRRVNDLLVQTLPALFDVGFTADMEKLLDEVEDGKTQWTSMLAEFYGKFEGWMANTKLPPADPAHVRTVLDLLAQVRQWAAPVTRGKRTYSDEEFAKSVGAQLAEGKKEISQRQLEVLVKMVWNYKDQIADAEAQLRAAGFGSLLERPEMQVSQEHTGRKLEVALRLSLSEKGRAFVESLSEQVKGGRMLTARQLAALNRVIESHATQIPDFTALRAELGLGEAPAADTESGPLLEAMQQVKTWNEPQQRGRRVFNDREFFESLAGQFSQRGGLTPRQVAALKKMMSRYRSQISGFADLAEKFGLRNPASEARPAAEADTATA